MVALGEAVPDRGQDHIEPTSRRCRCWSCRARWWGALTSMMMFTTELMRMMMMLITQTSCSPNKYFFFSTTKGMMMWVWATRELLQLRCFRARSHRSSSKNRILKQIRIFLRKLFRKGRWGAPWLRISSLTTIISSSNSNPSILIQFLIVFKVGWYRRLQLSRISLTTITRVVQATVVTSRPLCEESNEWRILASRVKQAFLERVSSPRR